MHTKEDIRAAVLTVKAMAEAIRELGEVPAGHLYAPLMGRMNLEQFQAIIGILKRAGLVKETEAHLLVWVGSAAKAAQ